MQSLLKIQGCPSEKESQLRCICHNLTVDARGLQSVRNATRKLRQSFNTNNCPRMPSKITVQVARKFTEDIWPIEEILDIIKREIEIREMGINVTSSDRKPVRQTNQPNRPSSNTQAFVLGEDKSKFQDTVQFLYQKSLTHQMHTDHGYRGSHRIL